MNHLIVADGLEAAAVQLTETKVVTKRKMLRNNVKTYELGLLQLNLIENRTEDFEDIQSDKSAIGVAQVSPQTYTQLLFFTYLFPLFLIRFCPGYFRSDCAHPIDLPCQFLKYLNRRVDNSFPLHL